MGKSHKKLMELSEEPYKELACVVLEKAVKEWNVLFDKSGKLPRVSYSELGEAERHVRQMGFENLASELIVFFESDRFCFLCDYLGTNADFVRENIKFENRKAQYLAGLVYR